MDYQEEYNQMLKEGVKNQQRFRYATIGIIAFVLGFGLAWVSFKGQDSELKLGALENNPNGNKNKIETTLEAVLPSDNNSNLNQGGEIPGVVVPTSSGISLRVDDQAPGKSVFIKEISAPGAVWVVIIENNDGEHGNILGAGLFDPEEKAGVVDLLRGTVEGGSYFAVLYKEDTDLEQDRSFDLEKDLPMVDSGGDLIEVSFDVTVLPG